ncbi:HesB/IscA family protein [Alkalihalobacterium chitinilyticum]|uniref:Iron-sulfur cluster assembly accessory protein n=1 Tax=Alkalihalobacterium chitinilyticum TaxID=2980103 RepID=A0ABT5VIQ8_9BACI|nr:iron-sulfur cluster assembly accessory protein [Alkalihalobacterium chitinilyticum]MDE5415343.1 iron-sulfur cluster assembly accessory protein [Alkalihalobacterium chitinilyticum]
MIIITESAIARIKEMLNEEEEQGLKLRIGVKGGGCSGLSYGMGFDKEEQDTDQKLDYDGLEVLVDEESAPVLKGVVIDYKQNMMGGGFTIENPNAIASCGCGSSFRTAENAGKPEEC